MMGDEWSSEPLSLSEPQAGTRFFDARGRPERYNGTDEDG